MKTNYWFAALSPVIGAIVAFATAAVMTRGSRLHSGNQAGASIWDVC